jgi:NitT/TauT family transport system ATP-binding protein
VTHNIEEAVLMCDRILVLGGHPGQLTTAIDVALPRPRERLESAFRAVVSQVYEMLTTRLAAALDASGQEAGAMHPLPQASVSRLIGLLEALEGAPYHGQAQLAALAATLAPQTKDLFALATALQLLQLADLKQGAIHLTAAGRVFVQSDLDERKRLFREHLESFVPFLAHMREVLQERADHRAPRERFELELQDHLNSTDSESTLLTAIGWGRYAELFSYDDASRSFSLL